MTDLVLAPKTTEIISQYKEELPQALLLTGEVGIGLSTVANLLSESHLIIANISPQLLTKTSTIPQISVERMRELYSEVRGKQIREAIVLVHDIDAMTESAQNAFLKLLEEPPQNIHFILTSHYPEKLLPTIHSRLHIQHIPRVSDEQSKALLKKLNMTDTTKQAQILFIARGLPAEMTKLALDANYFEKAKSTAQLAKILASGTSYDVTVAIQESKLDRGNAIELLDRLIAILSHKPTPRSIKQLSHAISAKQDIAANGNIKLQLLKAVL